jgi:hypothetical protein
MSTRGYRCEMVYRIDNGPEQSCQRLGHPVMTWNEERGQVEEEMLCREHERMLYGCHVCGEMKSSRRVPLCDDCLKARQAQKDDGSREKGGEAIA